MILSLERCELIEYTKRQLNYFFPDNNLVEVYQLNNIIDLTLDRLSFCFKHVAFERYNKKGETTLNHLYADQYLMFLWFLANTIWKEKQNDIIASKLYYLNKSLHGLDCMFDTNLPDIFLVFHGVGTMLGKAMYSDFFVVLQGCTVGSNNGLYPVLGKGVSLTANSSIIGNCKIEDRVIISTRTSIIDKNIGKDNVAFINSNNGMLEIKKSKKCYTQQFFNVDLNSI